jgi:hypothetical protein
MVIASIAKDPKIITGNYRLGTESNRGEFSKGGPALRIANPLDLRLTVVYDRPFGPVAAPLSNLCPA